MNTVLANKSNYGNVRNKYSIKFIVVHYTGNDGDSDSANAKYFQSPNRGASAHYFVGDNSITQSVPDNFIAWHCGTSGKYYHSTCRNANSIGIEMCDTLKDGLHNLSKKTRSNTIHLIQVLMKRYNIPVENVVRHYDVTHKLCPAYFVDESAWSLFKNEIIGNVTEYKPSKKDSFVIQVTASNLNIRAGAGTKYKVTGQIKDKGRYTITDEVNGWGKLKSGAGWITLKYCKRI